MELLARLSWVDLVIIGVLAAGVFAGFTQGMIRYVLNALAVLVAFILASQLKEPIFDLLRFWAAFTPEGRELLIFVILFFGFVIAGWFVIRALYHRTRLPIARSRGFHPASGTIRPSDDSPGVTSHFAFRLIGSLIPVPPGNRTSPPGVTS